MAQQLISNPFVFDNGGVPRCPLGGAALLHTSESIWSNAFGCQRAIDCSILTKLIRLVDGLEFLLLKNQTRDGYGIDQMLRVSCTN